MANGILKVGQITNSAGSGNITIGSGVTVNVNRPSFMGYNSSAYQTVTDAAATKITIDTEEFDTDSAFDTSTSKFTIPANQAGKYLIFGQFYTYSSNDTGRLSQISLYKNGSETANTINITRLTQNDIVGAAVYTSYIYNASVSDYFELYGLFNVDSGTDNRIYYANFGGYKLGA